MQSDQNKHSPHDEQVTLSNSHPNQKNNWWVFKSFAAINLALLLLLVVYVKVEERSSGVSNAITHRTNGIDGVLIDVICRLGIKASAFAAGPTRCGQILRQPWCVYTGHRQNLS